MSARGSRTSQTDATNANDIYVDLDGTLIRTDLFLESLLRLVKSDSLYFFKIVFWLFKGRSFVKYMAAKSLDCRDLHLPFETELLEYLNKQKEQGRRIVLATAAHRIHAESIARQLGMFDHVIATDIGNNLKGRRKLRAILDEVGEGGFVYAGNSAADRPIWRAASANIFVNAPKKDVQAALVANKAEKIISSRPPLWRAFLNEMRPYQYAKNILIFVPAFTSYSYQQSAVLLSTVMAFICFSLCASGAYFLNDLLDLDSDRQHATKRERPLASGDLSLLVGVVGAITLPVMSFGLALATLPGIFVGVLVFYFLLTNVYSFALKRIPTADVMTLAVLYTWRVVAGAAATGIVLSSWLTAFSVFVFVSLACLKRYIEVAALQDQTSTAPGRGYSATDSETMFGLGVATIAASVLVLALYINSEDVVRLYQSPEVLWLLCFFMLYWGSHIWIAARRGQITDDPVVFAIKDRTSQVMGMLFLATVLFARFFNIRAFLA